MADPESPKVFTPAFQLLCLFYFLVFAVGYQLFPVVPLHLRSLGADLAESGRFMGAFTLGSAIGSLFTGPLGDRLGQRRVLRIASLLMVAFFVAYAFIDDPAHRWVFYVLAPVHGLIWSGLRTASVAKAGSMLMPEHRAEGMSFFGLSSPSGVAAGPVVGLLLLGLLGFRWQMLALGAAFLVLNLLAKYLPRETPGQLRRDAAFQLPEKVVLLPVIILFLVGVSFGPMPPYSAQEAKFLHASWTSALLTSLALGMVGLRGLLGFTGMGRRPIQLLSLMLWMSVAGMALLALLPGVTLRHALGGAIYGAGYAMTHTLIFMVIINRSKPDRRGAGVGALYFAYDAGQAAGAFLLGNAMEWIGHGWGLAAGYRWGWALGGLALAGCLFLARRVMHPSPSEEDPPGRVILEP
jgi:MFS family permease